MTKPSPKSRFALSLDSLSPAQRVALVIVLTRAVGPVALGGEKFVEELLRQQGIQNVSELLQAGLDIAISAAWQVGNLQGCLRGESPPESAESGVRAQKRCFEALLGEPPRGYGTFFVTPEKVTLN